MQSSQLQVITDFGLKVGQPFIKEGALIQIIILAFPLKKYGKINICPIKLDFAQPYAEMGSKMTYIWHVSILLFVTFRGALFATFYF